MSQTVTNANMELGTLESILERIQAEPLETVRRRQKEAFDYIAGPLREKIVLFGAGQLGRDTLRGLRKVGVEPLAFADNNQRLWGTEVDGLSVLSAADAANHFAKSACFVVTIYSGASVRLQLRQLGCQSVAHFVPLYWKFSDVFVPHSGIDLPEMLRDQFADIGKCYSILSDDESRRQILEQLIWRYWLDQSWLSVPDNLCDTYFPFDLLTPRPDEVFVDCGSFDGETIRRFSERWSGHFRHIFAFEPDANNCTLLHANVIAMGVSSRVTIIESAVGDVDGKLHFLSLNSVTSHVVKSDSGEVQCCRLDDVQWEECPPTYIKMDIESSEPEALSGAAELLRRYRPVLAICTYHRVEHLWQIPVLIHSITPDYELFIRRYAEDCWETVCYAVPQHRLCVR